MKNVAAWLISITLVILGFEAVSYAIQNGITLWSFFIAWIGWSIVGSPAMEKWESFFIKQWDESKDKNAE
jgi:hypothetical protein